MTVQPQPGFPIGFVGSMTLKTTIGQQRQNIAAEVDIASGRSSCCGAQESEHSRNRSSNHVIQFLNGLADTANDLADMCFLPVSAYLFNL